MKSSPRQRGELLEAWGGTTTAPRRDWRQIVSSGLDEGWYRIVVGTLQQLRRDDEGLRLGVSDGERSEELAVDYVVDATGLVSQLDANPVLGDLVETHALPLNVQGRLEVAPDFEVRALRNGSGRFYAAGVATLGGPYAPVDSFLGLQWSAMASLDTLVPRLTPGRSFAQWRRWVAGRAP